MVDLVYQSKGRALKTVTWKVLELWGSYKDGQGDQGTLQGMGMERGL